MLDFLQLLPLNENRLELSEAPKSKERQNKGEKCNLLLEMVYREGTGGKLQQSLLKPFKSGTKNSIRISKRRGNDSNLSPQ